MRQLLTAPNPILRQKCDPADAFNDDVHKLIKEMAEFMYSRRADRIAPIGFAAPQLGESLCVIVFYPNPYFRELNAIDGLINPELVYAREPTPLSETCLSIPGREFIVQRAKVVKVRGYTFGGYSKTYKARDLLAQVFQHEIDHLDGVLIDSIGKLVTGR